MTKSPGKVRVGALAVLATCFAASAVVRVGEVVAALPGSEDRTEVVNATAEGGPPPAGAEDSVGRVRAPEEVVAELRRQRERLDRREAELAEREQQLEAIGKRLTDRLDELKAERKRLEATAALVNDAAGEDVRRLALMYGQMKPKQAALIFDKMAPSFAAGFLSEMRPEAAALIMANMEADKAYAVSLLMAGRNVDRGEAGPATTRPTGE